MGKTKAGRMVIPKLLAICLGFLISLEQVHMIFGAITYSSRNLLSDWPEEISDAADGQYEEIPSAKVFDYGDKSSELDETPINFEDSFNFADKSLWDDHPEEVGSNRPSPFLNLEPAQEKKENLFVRKGSSSNKGNLYESGSVEGDLTRQNKGKEGEEVSLFPESLMKRKSRFASLASDMKNGRRVTRLGTRLTLSSSVPIPDTEIINEGEKERSVPGILMDWRRRENHGKSTVSKEESLLFSYQIPLPYVRSGSNEERVKSGEERNQNGNTRDIGGERSSSGGQTKKLRLRAKRDAAGEEEVEGVSNTEAAEMAQNDKSISGEMVFDKGDEVRNTSSSRPTPLPNSRPNNAAAPSSNPMEALHRLHHLLERMLRELSQFGQRFTLRLIRMTERHDIDQMQEIMKDFEISPAKPIFFIAGGLRKPNVTKKGGEKGINAGENDSLDKLKGDDVATPTTTVPPSSFISAIMNDTVEEEGTFNEFEGNDTSTDDLQESTMTPILRPASSEPETTMSPVEFGEGETDAEITTEVVHDHSEDENVTETQSSIISDERDKDEHSDKIIPLEGHVLRILRRSLRSIPEFDEFEFMPVPGRSARTENPYDEDDDFDDDDDDDDEHDRDHDHEHGDNLKEKHLPTEGLIHQSQVQVGNEIFHLNKSDDVKNGSSGGVQPITTTSDSTTTIERRSNDQIPMKVETVADAATTLTHASNFDDGEGISPKNQAITKGDLSSSQNVPDGHDVTKIRDIGADVGVQVSQVLSKTVDPVIHESPNLAGEEGELNSDLVKNNNSDLSTSHNPIIIGSGGVEPSPSENNDAIEEVVREKITTPQENEKVHLGEKFDIADQRSNSSSSEEVEVGGGMKDSQSSFVSSTAVDDQVQIIPEDNQQESGENEMVVENGDIVGRTPADASVLMIDPVPQDDGAKVVESEIKSTQLTETDEDIVPLTLASSTGDKLVHDDSNLAPSSSPTVLVQPTQDKTVSSSVSDDQEKVTKLESDSENVNGFGAESFGLTDKSSGGIVGGDVDEMKKVEKQEEIKSGEDLGELSKFVVGSQIIGNVKPVTAASTSIEMVENNVPSTQVEESDKDSVKNSDNETHIIPVENEELDLELDEVGNKKLITAGATVSDETILEKRDETKNLPSVPLKTEVVAEVVDGNKGSDSLLAVPLKAKEVGGSHDTTDGGIVPQSESTLKTPDNTKDQVGETKVTQPESVVDKVELEPPVSIQPDVADLVKVLKVSGTTETAPVVSVEAAAPATSLVDSVIPVKKVAEPQATLPVVSGPTTATPNVALLPSVPGEKVIPEVVVQGLKVEQPAEQIEHLEGVSPVVHQEPPAVQKTQAPESAATVVDVVKETLVAPVSVSSSSPSFDDKPTTTSSVQVVPEISTVSTTEATTISTSTVSTDLVPSGVTHESPQKPEVVEQSQSVAAAVDTIPSLTEATTTSKPTTTETTTTPIGLISPAAAPQPEVPSVPPPAVPQSIPLATPVSISEPTSSNNGDNIIIANLPGSDPDSHFGVKPIDTLPHFQIPGINKPSIPDRPHPEDYLAFVVKDVDPSTQLYFAPAPNQVIVTSPPVQSSYTPEAILRKQQLLMKNYFSGFFRRIIYTD